MNVSDALPAKLELPVPRLSPLVRSIVTVVVLTLMAWWLVPRDAPLTQLEVRGDFKHLRPEDVRAVATPLLASSFFAADLDGLRNAVATLPWVARARVERRWPGALSIRVWERKAFARWNEAGLLDIEAQAFGPRASDIPLGLPQLGGSRGHEADVARSWLQIAPPLQHTNLELAGLSLDARGEWTARTLNGIDLRFGQRPPAESIPRIVEVVLRTLDGRWGEVLYVDLRYSNGFAVGWRETDAAKESKR